MQQAGWHSAHWDEHALTPSVREAESGEILPQCVLPYRRSRYLPLYRTYLGRRYARNRPKTGSFTVAPPVLDLLTLPCRTPSNTVT